MDIKQIYFFFSRELPARWRNSKINALQLGIADNFDSSNTRLAMVTASNEGGGKRVVLGSVGIRQHFQQTEHHTGQSDSSLRDIAFLGFRQRKRCAFNGIEIELGCKAADNLQNY